MAHLALPASWIDEVFQANRHRRYLRELLFSSVVELMLLVTLGLRPSLHAAARKMAQRSPVSLAALYAKVQRALVQGSAERLVPLVGCLPERQSLPELAGIRRQPPAGQRETARGHCVGSGAQLCPVHAGGVRPGQRAGVRHRRL